MNAMLEPRMAAARIQGSALLAHGRTNGTDCIAASSQGGFVEIGLSQWQVAERELSHSQKVENADWQELSPYLSRDLGRGRPWVQARRSVSNVISGGTPMRTGMPKVPSPRFT